MATGLKTIEYWFSELTAVSENTDTNFTQITIDIPETVSAFRSVVLHVVFHDLTTTTHNVRRRQTSLRLSAVAYSAVSNTNAVTNSGEDLWLDHSADFTSYFTTNWTGTSMTCDARILADSVADPGGGFACATARLTITYAYDDTAATHVKTVRIPLVTPLTTVMPTSKPGSATDTIPNLSTFLPENTVTIKQYTIVVQGNESIGSGFSTDSTISWEIDTAGAWTSGTHEKSRNSSNFFRHCQTQSFATNATHSWYLWASSAVGFHLQAFLVVTYTFATAGTSTVLNSLLLPLAFSDPGGGTATSAYQRAYIDLWIEEPTTITVTNSAFLLFYHQPLGYLSVSPQYRINASAWSGTLYEISICTCYECGSQCASYRCETFFTLSRGKNTIYVDVTRPGTTYNLSGLSGYFILNYTSGIAAGGVSTHNHTVFWKMLEQGTVIYAINWTTSSLAITIPEANVFYNNWGFEILLLANGQCVYGHSVQVERLAAEGGIMNEDISRTTSYSAAETGLYWYYPNVKGVFPRWTGDVGKTRDGLARIDPETARPYKASCLVGVGAWVTLSHVLTYHSITRTVSGTISGSAGGTVSINLVRSDTLEVAQSTSRAGNGSYSFTWFDDTVDVFCEAKEDTTHVGRSANGAGT